MPPTKFGFGKAVRRKEDDAFVRGVGRYVADYMPGGLLHAVVLRSPHAHARFRITDLAKAKALPGVALVLTAADTAELGDLPCQAALPGDQAVAPALSGPGGGGGAPCRRRRGLRGGRLDR